MHLLVWSREATNYLNDNLGLVDDLELAFADLRKAKDGFPATGVVDKKFGPNRYSWNIHEHTIIIRRGTEQGQPKLWIEAIKPIASENE